MNTSEIQHEWTLVEECILKPRDSVVAVEMLDETMFTVTETKHIFSAIAHLCENGKPSDLDHILPVLERRGHFTVSLGDELRRTALEIRDFTTPMSEIAGHVLENYQRRETRQMFETALKQLRSGARPDETLDTVNQQAETITAGTEQHSRSPLKIRLDDFKPFPLDLLPDVLKQFASESASAIGCDPTFSVMPALAVCAAAIGTARRLQIKSRWYAPSLLWMVTIGESGSQKSPAHRLAVEPLNIRQNELVQKYSASQAAYHESLQAYRDVPKADKHNVELPDKPVRERCIVTDTTIEALGAILKDNPRGLLLSRDELSGWIGSFDKYTRGSGSSDVQRWLEIYSCEPIFIDRKTGEQTFVHVPRPSVSICGGVQPGILARCLTTEHKENGLQSRLLLAYPPRKAKRWSDADVSSSTLQAYHDAVKELFTLKPDTDSDGAEIPCLLTLTDDARDLFKSFVNSHGQESNAMSGHQASQWSKLEETPARLAVVFHCVKQVTTRVADYFTIDGGTMRSAISVTEWFKSECLRINKLLSEPEETREIRQLVEWIRQRGGRITARNLARCRRDIESGSAAETKLIHLVRIGAGRWERKHSSRTFVLSPELSTLGALTAGKTG